MQSLSAILYSLFFHLLTTCSAHDRQLPISSEQISGLSHPHRVAIIGAGAAGSSAAYHLRQFASSSSHDLQINITVFDSNAKVGGRTTTVDALDDPRYPTEVGASIFVKINHILYNATRDFGLSTKDKIYRSTGSTFDLGIWDGHSFVFTIANDDDEEQVSLQRRWKGWWDIAKLLWKYGLSPIRTQRLTKSTVGRFLRFYDDLFPFESLNDAVGEVGLLDFTGTAGRDVLANAGVSDTFAREIIQSSTRVNYAQNLGTIHGLETLVCMAIEGAMAIDGGNWQIFDQAVKRSYATLKLNTTVAGVRRTEEGSYTLGVLDEQRVDDISEFDTVILAAPYQYAGLTFDPPLDDVPSKVDYVQLHVTLFTSPHRPSPVFFGLEGQEQVPDSVLTTLPEGLDLGTARGIGALGPNSFWSLSTLRVLEPATDGYVGPQVSEGHISPDTADLGRQYLYKVFSPTPVSATDLAELFALNYTDPCDLDDLQCGVFEGIGQLSKTDVTWFHERVWNSYPYLPPRTDFGSFKLHQSRPSNGVPIVEEDGPSLWYTSAIEPFISTMETSALSGMNIARQIVDQLEGRTERRSPPAPL